ncbi:MAG: D-arabinose 5-phosphate isomerase [Ignavibacteria bacterium RIFCSPLOWO2_12_FULL_56_21]|nr:MAG: D-arabinose 5-phosphate isomerase [Ignavibacteria bacterium GWC2_56_12]OGU65841.1 MAG: D-arabinose 5-phosphate isomerase [Ignavibacteria bacterium RIFCSPHIGHO2_02_FULL_56_12]OGU70531.1 MAG: D-arabinose 5-phosphate isomerase [Ignavibacteria bacterium RIFCSPLOWO2_12_FULL_56_21]HAV22849.1 D-arabinose 5-phosphate isomerase [Bacteroidota bacterium]
MNSIIEHGRKVVQIEGEAVAALADRVNGDFARAVEIIFAAKGRVIVTGMGKSGIIARKLVATFNSTGTAAIFLHPSDAVHGDLGTVRKEDVVICISKSGNTAEIRQLMPVFRHLGVPIISMVGNMKSELARTSDVVLDISVKEEACPLDLAPTASTTAMLVMGDAIAIALLKQRNFTREDFAMFHPGGNLGKQLLLQVEHFMVTGAGVPKVSEDVPLSEAIMEMTSKRLGATCVVNGTGALSGIITDGDLRRMLQRKPSINELKASDAMTRNPKTISLGTLAVAALEVMESYKITQLVVVDAKNVPHGIVHLHDLVKAGLGGEELQS